MDGGQLSALSRRSLLGHDGNQLMIQSERRRLEPSRSFRDQGRGGRGGGDTTSLRCLLMQPTSSGRSSETVPEALTRADLPRRKLLVPVHFRHAWLSSVVACTNEVKHQLKDLRFKPFFERSLYYSSPPPDDGSSPDPGTRTPPPFGDLSVFSTPYCTDRELARFERTVLRHRQSGYNLHLQPDPVEYRRPNQGLQPAFRS